MLWLHVMFVKLLALMMKMKTKILVEFEEHEAEGIVYFRWITGFTCSN